MSPFWISFGAEDDGGVGDNWRYKMCKAPVKMSPTANQHPVFRLDALALSVIATATWLGGCPSQPVLYQND